MSGLTYLGPIHAKFKGHHECRCYGPNDGSNCTKDEALEQRPRILCHSTNIRIKKKQRDRKRNQHLPKSGLPSLVS
jgi:hypothetical protein